MVTFESSEEIQPAFNSNNTTETTEEKMHKVEKEQLRLLVKIKQ